MSRRIIVLSLGAGVQSTALALMSCRGELPKIDHAIFSDTQYEPPAVYEHLEWLKGELATAGIPFHQVTRGNLRHDAIEFRQSRASADGKRFASIPLFVLNPDRDARPEPEVVAAIAAMRLRADALRNRLLTASIELDERRELEEELGVVGEDMEQLELELHHARAGTRIPGGQGLIRRQCTSEYKIEPIERYVRQEILGLKPRQVSPRHCVIDYWFGITQDEKQRMRVSPEPWRENVYPFCCVPGPLSARFTRSNGAPRPWTRQDCKNWLAENYPGRNFPRSACICCPYRSNEEWRNMRENDPDSWADACDFDDEIRQADREGQSLRKMLVGLPFTHRTMVPLRDAKIDEVDDAQPSLFPGLTGMGNECQGMCGV